MIEIQNVSKKFNNFYALKDITATMEEGHVFGLIGTNGAGKSTLMRTISGIYQADNGCVMVDGENIYDNPKAKANIFYISDDQYFFSSGTPKDMLNYYSCFYPGYDTKRFYELMDILKLSPDRKINTFSKGMKKQVSVILGICSGCKYILCDETFDGLDPVMRQAVKRLFIQEMDNRGLTPIIASHNLRELEDICDHIGLLHNGGILFNKDLEDMKLGIAKLQIVFKNNSDYELLTKEFEPVVTSTQGSLYTLTLRGNYDAIEARVNSISPIFYELLPLSLEEIFITETEVLGYDFKNLTV